MWMPSSDDTRLYVPSRVLRNAKFALGCGGGAKHHRCGGLSDVDIEFAGVGQKAV